MKNVSKWLLAGTIFAAAFACQSKTSESPSNKDQKQNKQNRKGCEQSKVEQPLSKPAAEANKSSAPSSPVAEKSAASAQPLAEKKAAPVSAPAIRVVEQSPAPAAKETPAQSPMANESKPAHAAAPNVTESTQAPVESPVSSSDSITTPAPAIKAESSAKVTPSNPTVSAAENQPLSVPAK